MAASQPGSLPRSIQEKTGIQEKNPARSPAGRAEQRAAIDQAAAGDELELRRFSRDIAILVSRVSHGISPWRGGVNLRLDGAADLVLSGTTSIAVAQSIAVRRAREKPRGRCVLESFDNGLI